MLSTYPLISDEFVINQLDANPFQPAAGAIAYPVDLEREKEARCVVLTPHPVPGVTARVEVSVNNGITWVTLVAPFNLVEGARVATSSPINGIPASLRAENALVRVKFAAPAGLENVNIGFVHLQTR